MLCAAFGLVAIQGGARGDAALDRAARGTIHLERMNGLVYAVVMESRGIYMSADWKAAEPFAKKLVKQLAQLQDTVHLWKDDTIASQRANVDALAGRINEVVSFPNQLAHLPRGQGPATGRISRQ